MFVSIDGAVGHGADRPFGVYPPRAYVMLEFFNQPGVFEHEQMRVEYERVLVAELFGEPDFDYLQLRARLLQSLAQAPDFHSRLGSGHADVVELMAATLIEP